MAFYSKTGDNSPSPAYIIMYKSQRNKTIMGEEEKKPARRGHAYASPATSVL